MPVRTLHNSQLNMFARIHNLLDSKKDRGVAVAPPGFGKTSVITAVLDFVASKFVKHPSDLHGVALMLTPRLMLNEQQRNEIEQMEIYGLANVKKSVRVFDCLNGLAVGAILEFIQNCHTKQTFPVIISTYTSCAKLKDIKFDLIICDEGHNVTGEITFTDVMDVLDHEAKRIFITATPRLNITDGKARNRGMGNQEYYGDFIYTLSFKRAAQLGFILPIRRVFIDTYGESATKENYIVDLVIKSMNRMKQAMGDSPLPNKVIFVFNTKVEIEVISTNWKRIYNEAGAKVFTGFSERDNFKVNGSEPKGDGEIREAFINELKNESGDCILAHIDTMGEGVDVPGITGCILFGTNDVIRIIQNIGRAMRILPSDRNLPSGQRIKKVALLGIVSYNGEISNQEFLNGLARAMHQMKSDTFYNKYLTTHMTDKSAGKRSMDTEGESENHLIDQQLELLGIESSEQADDFDLFDDGDIECDTITTLDQMIERMEVELITQEKLGQLRQDLKSEGDDLRARFTARMKKK